MIAQEVSMAKKKSMKLGGGGRFAKLAAKIGPAAAAAAGRKKYGKKGMAALAKRGTAGAPTARAEAKRIRARKKK
jgi:hypothetical protein